MSTASLATAWIEHATRLMQNQVQDATSATQRILTAERKSGAPAIARDFADLLTQALPIPQQKANAIHKLLARPNIDPEQPITRGNASHLIFQVLASK